MSIHFTPEQWAKVKQDARLWWEGKLERPLLCFTLYGQPADRAPSAQPMRHFTAFYDAAVAPEEIIDSWDYDLACKRFLGDAFPVQWANFGPGVLAAFLGADIEADGRTVWFHPKVKQPLQELQFRLDPGNPWLRRVQSIYAAGQERWGDQVLQGMTDLGGTLDVLSTFRPGAELLLDLYDDPETVQRLSWEIHERWWECFTLLNETLQPGNPGYSCWPTFYSEEPFYMLQCDFAYMISPAMFDQFVKPELAATCRKLKNAFYHLDGPGQLPHLDSLLSIPELKGIQWVPGDGQPDVSQWPEVYRRIRDAGKLIQVFTGQCHRGLEIVDILADQLGSAAGIVFVGGVSPSEAEQAQTLLRKYGAQE